MTKDNNKIDRRGFLKLMGESFAAATATTTLIGCKKGSLKRGGTALTEVPTDKMTYRTNHNTGDEVSLLGYGMMRLPLRQKADGTGEEVDQEMVNELVDYALAHGVNYFDTSATYVRGWSETATGKALSRHPRNSYMVATKFSNHNFTEWRKREEAIALYNRSKANLQVDYLDYYLLHACGVGTNTYTTESDLDEQFDTMDKLVLKERFFDNGMLDYLVEERKGGRIRNLGWSFHGKVEIFDFMLGLHDSGKYHWDFVQIQLNYVDWKYASGWNVNAEYLYGELAKRNIPVVIMEPLLGGRLASNVDYLSARLKQHRPQNSIASWAFRYAGSYPKVLSVLSGMTYMEHLQENIRTYSPLDELTEDEFELLADTATRMIEYPSVPCTACEYCMPCPYGINIPAIFTHYNKCINEANVPYDTQDSNYRKARKAFLVGYDRSVPKLRQANYCIGCNQCVHHCPQAIKIPQELHRIDRYTETLKQEKS